MPLPVSFKNAGIPLDLGGLSNALDIAQSNMTDTSNPFQGRENLKIDQDDGSWVFGVDEMEVDANDKIAIDPSSFEQGWISWKKAEVAGEVMVSISEPMPLESSLTVTGADWRKQFRFDAVLLETGEQLIFKSSSLGGGKAVSSVFKALRGALAKHPTYHVPVITLSSNSYINKNYANKKIFNPVFIMVDWATADGDLMSEVKKVTQEEPAQVEEPAIQEEIVKTENVETANDTGQLDIEKVNVNEKTDPTPEPKEDPKPAGRQRRTRARG